MGHSAERRNGTASDCSLPRNTSYSKQIKMDSKATMLHSTAQKGVEVVFANKPMIAGGQALLALSKCGLSAFTWEKQRQGTEPLLSVRF